jgi:hypothetical protein
MLSVFGHGSHQKPLSGTAANGAKLVYLELAANLIINKFISANFLDCHAWGREWVLPRDFGYELSNHDRHSDGKDNEGPLRGRLSVCKSGDDLDLKRSAAPWLRGSIAGTFRSNPVADYATNNKNNQCRS